MKLSKCYKLVYIFAIVVLTQAMTCENFDESETMFHKNAKGHPEFNWLTTVNAEQFNKKVVGKGWKWKSSSRITDDGKTEEFVFAGNGNPKEYYFTPDSVWVFSYYQDRNLRQCSTYDYDETENQVNSPLIEYMQICSLNAKSMETIEQTGDIGYFVNEYEVMMPFELNARMLGFEPVTE